MMIQTTAASTNWLGILQIGVTIAGMLFAPWWAVQKSLAQFRSQKWWENQAIAYSLVLGKLAILKHQNRAWYLWITEGQNLPIERKDEFYKEYQSTMKELERSTTANCLFLSDSAVKALEGFIDKTRPDVHLDMLQEIEKDWDSIRDCIAQIKAAAYADLKSQVLST